MSSAMDAFADLSQCTPPSPVLEDLALASLSPCTPVDVFEETPRTPDILSMAPCTPETSGHALLEMTPSTPKVSFVRRRITRKSQPPAPCAESSIGDSPFAQEAIVELAAFAPDAQRAEP